MLCFEPASQIQTRFRDTQSKKKRERKKKKTKRRPYQRHRIEHSNTLKSHMILARKWWSDWILFRVGRTVRKCQAKDNKKKKNTINISVGNGASASKTKNRIPIFFFTFILDFFFHFTCSLASLRAACIFLYARPQICEQFTVNYTLAHTCRQYYRGRRHRWCCAALRSRRAAFFSFAFLFHLLPFLERTLRACLIALHSFKSDAL